MTNEIKIEEMEQVVGGKSVFDNFEKRKVSGLKNGEEVQVYYDCTRNGYTWVYFPKLNKSGWVNSNFVK